MGTTLILLKAILDWALRLRIDGVVGTLIPCVGGHFELRLGSKIF